MKIKDDYELMQKPYDEMDSYELCRELLNLQAAKAAIIKLEDQVTTLLMQQRTTG